VLQYYQDRRMPITSPLIQEQLNRLPRSPGVYLFKDAAGAVLYVGKAANLQNRVRSYFAPGQGQPDKIQRLVSRTAELDFLLTASEQEALILELNLIKRHHPHFNVRLKDDKSFPYLRIETSTDFPRVYVTRRREEDGGRYFGPFTDARSVRQTLKFIRGIFPFRTCPRKIPGGDTRPCLEYHLGRCAAPCAGAVSREEYAAIIREVILFLEGRQERVIRELEKKMDAAAAALDFEKAARLRDQVAAVRTVMANQKITTRVQGEQDIIAFAQEGDIACAQVFFIRNDKITGRESFILQGTLHEAPEQIMASFIQQFYASSHHLPSRLLLQHPAAEAAAIKEWLQGRSGRRVELQVPRRGGKKGLVDMVAQNARQGLEQLKIKQLAAPRAPEAALAEIAGALGLAQPPLRMEAYDISNLQGQAAVGSMVVFEKGRAKPAQYRRFKIKTVPGANDYAMLGEVLRRRFQHAGGTGAPEAWAAMPDLVLIDGGRGQLNAAMAALGEMDVSVPVASIAKENEQLFRPQRAPISLTLSSPGLQMLQRLRDEAHRFAISYHTRLRRRQTFTSLLDGIPGIGPRRKRTLLRRFGSLGAIRQASVEELTTGTGISRSLAQKIKELL